MTEQAVSVDQVQGALRASIGEHAPTDQHAQAVAEFMAADGISVVHSFDKLALAGASGSHSHIAKAAVIVASVYSQEFAQHIADRLSSLSDLQVLRWVFEHGHFDFDSTHQEMLAHALSTTVVDLQATLRVWKLVDSADRWEQILASHRASVRKPEDTAEFRHFVGKARAAARGGRNAWDVQSTGERVAVALALNKPAWLKSMGYSMVEAIERTGSTWVALMPAVVRDLRDAGDL
ncbi:hypothetical protein GmRootV118_20430 [Variovorax sp. V118]